MKLKEKILTIFGDIKLQKWPPFFYYQRGDYYRVSGEDTRKVLETARPGDLILRGYDNYLDGKFIPGEYSHTGVYVGDGDVIHAIAEGVSKQSAIDFLRCDRCMLLRPDSGARIAVDRVTKWLGTPYDFDFSSDNSALYCHELAAEAYKEFRIPKIVPYLGFIRFMAMTPKYLAESFMCCGRFREILEINRKREK